MGDVYTKQIVRKNGGYKSGYTNAVVLDLFIRNECSKEREHQYCNQYRVKWKLNGKEGNPGYFPFVSLISWAGLGSGFQVQAMAMALASVSHLAQGPGQNASHCSCPG